MIPTQNQFYCISDYFVIAVQHERVPRTKTKDESDWQSYPLPSYEPPSYSSSSSDAKDRSYSPEQMEPIQPSPSPKMKAHGLLTPPHTPKQSVITLQSAEHLYELSVRILYTTITWARNIPTFSDLPFKDQISVLEMSWMELFLLSLAQWEIPLDIDLMLQIGGIAKDDILSPQITGTITELVQLQNVVHRFKGMQLDATEYACLKAVALFAPGRVMKLN